MSRKKVDFTIEDTSSRDFGKTFLIEEMSPLDGDEFASNTFRIMGENNFTGIPQDVIAMGCAGLATYGIAALQSAGNEVYLHMRSKLLSTVYTVNTDESGKPFERKLNPMVDIEEISTIRQLMDKVFSVNFDFFTLGDALNSPSPEEKPKRRHRS